MESYICYHVQLRTQQPQADMSLEASLAVNSLLPPPQVKNNHTLLCVPAMLGSCLIIPMVIFVDIKSVSVFVHSCVCVLCVHMSFMCMYMCRCATIFLLNEELPRIQSIFDSFPIFVELYCVDSQVLISEYA